MASNTIILGAGIIGLSTAYYLSQFSTPSSIHLVDPSPTLFASASGYAGGFLAADWFSAPVAALGQLSFEEHKRLAKENGGQEKWGYSRSKGISYAPEKGKGKAKERGEDWLRHGTSRAVAANDVGDYASDGEEEGPSWLRRVEGDSIEAIGEDGRTAQVDPLRLCQFLLKECLDRGVQLHHPARAISIGKDMRDELPNLRILNTETHTRTHIPCTRILIAAGAWSREVFSTLFPDAKMKLPIRSLAGHSLVLGSSGWKKEHEGGGCHAVFTTDDEGYSPEIFSRMGEEIYIAGLNSSSLPLPKLATESKIDEGAVEKLMATAERLVGTAGQVSDLEVVRKGLCFRPVTARGTPILTRIPDEDLGDRVGEHGGVFLASGHGPWGISMSLGTGKVMAEMIQGRPTSVDVGGLRL